VDRSVTLPGRPALCQ